MSQATPHIWVSKEISRQRPDEDGSSVSQVVQDVSMRVDSLFVIMAKLAMQHAGTDGLHISTESMIYAYLEAIDRSVNVTVTDLSGVIIWANENFVKTSGFSREELIGRDHKDVVKSWAHDKSVYDDLWNTLRRGEKWRKEIRNKNKDGSFTWFDAIVWPLQVYDEMEKDPEKRMKTIGYISVRFDITEKVRLRQRQEALFNDLNGWVCEMTLDRKLQDVNPHLAELLWYSREELIGLDARVISHPDDEEMTEEGIRTMLEWGARRLSFEKRFVRKDHTVLWWKVSMTCVCDASDEPLYFITSITDITELKRTQEKLEHAAMHDDLTGLPNRRHSMESLQRELDLSRRDGKVCSVLFLDLDGFKKVNDTLGHKAWDEVLRLAAERMKRHVRKTDIVSRLWWDEFFLILPRATEEQAYTSARSLLEILSQPYLISLDPENPENTTEIDYVCASIGISSSSKYSDKDTLMSTADDAMYYVKLAGKRDVAIFEESMRGAKELLKKTTEGQGK